MRRWAVEVGLLLLLLLIAAGLLIMAIAAGRAERRASSPLRVVAAFVAGAALPFALVWFA